jgi:hypothetical protein
MEHFFLYVLEWSTIQLLLVAPPPTVAVESGYMVLHYLQTILVRIFGTYSDVSLSICGGAVGAGGLAHMLS